MEEKSQKKNFLNFPVVRHALLGMRRREDGLHAVGSCANASHSGGEIVASRDRNLAAVRAMSRVL